MKKIHLGLLGKSIAHSLSPKLYADIYGAENLEYHLFDFETAKEIPSLLQIFSVVSGLSITTPYKEHFLEDVSFINNEVKELQAINCIGLVDKKFHATNTDYSALNRLLPQMLRDRSEILILGNGAMARVVARVCLKHHLKFHQWSRSQTPEKFQLMNIKSVADGNILVINCCARNYVFHGTLPEKSLFWDMNYRHLQHDQLFLNSSQYIDGQNLLLAQAQDAAAFWSSLKN